MATGAARNSRHDPVAAVFLLASILNSLSSSRCRGVKFCRRFDFDHDIEIALALAVQPGHALAAGAQQRAMLRARRHRDDDFFVFKACDRHFGAERSVGKRNRLPLV